MLSTYKYILIVFFSCYSLTCFAQFSKEQQHRIDSLNQLLEDKTSPDTSVVGAYVSLSEILYITNIDTLTYLCSKAKKLAEENLSRNDLNDQEIKTFKSFLAIALNNIGYNKGIRGDLDAELDYFEQSLQLKKEINDEKGIAIAYNNIGSIYKQQGQMTKALSYYDKSLKIKDKLGDTRGVALSYGNIGVIYENQEQFDTALEYYKRSLKLYQSIKNKQGEAVAYNNMALVYSKINNIEKCLESNQKSLALRKEINDRRGIANSLNNLGLAYREIGDTEKALKAYLESISIKEEIGDIRGLSATINNTGYIYFREGNIQKAKSQGELALKYAQQVGVVEMIRNSADLLDKVYYDLGQYKKSHEMKELYYTMRDSISNKQIKDEALKQNLKYEYQKAALADSLAYEENKKIEKIRHNIAMEKQTTYTIIGIVGLVLVLFFSLFVVNRLRITRSQKNIIEQAHEELGEKNQEIMDSITYAKRIQSAILPPSKVVKEYLKESFILYKPKDIVAGDFYWLEHVGGKVLFAAADCTGHGVPGAMVSVVCNNGLNRSVREHELSDPGQILDKTREIVIQEFEKSEDEVKDGMDIALCCLEGNKLRYAGAHNPLWIVRNGEIIETKANKQPIGQFDHPEPYTTHSFELQPGDSIYIFSDGYVDQFGGEKGKKFKAKAFRELLLSIQDKSMEEQKEIIDSTFEAWKGELEQIDDVCVIGVKV